MEVTDEWLEAEEEQAAFLRDIDLAWGTDLGSQDHDTSEPADANSTSMRNDVLKIFTVDHCKVIDKIFRQEETSSGIPSLPVPETEPEWTAEVSPAERRRLKKRLHMRHKRAEIAGTDIVTDTQRLQCGRKRKAVGSPPYTPSQVNSDSEEGSEFEDRHKKRQRKRGLTREQKVLETFIDLEIDAAVRHNQGLDLFHLHPLGRLLTKDRIDKTAASGVQYASAQSVAYKALGITGDVFIHPSSVLFKYTPPEYLIFNEVMRTSQVWLKGLTVINPAWLSSQKNSAGILTVVPHFGPDGWELPPIKAEHP
ncbi:uncharacterized protein C8R40DRAFT_1071095 [Lentinula edodes]|uniref:uncharacterized protein n=1 Tax=Lentinula edodes TaxID=5353 RepID=UPI001E8DF8C1|nr:uncharacterized protein C8R40DRAFT_1071095 [Lentinula edodes]KAH7873113.1 hypothetical protein C8R40DRAFT_1071095 [Lentinula edodes]